MASYPLSVKTFTTKNAGDTIQPADVNDLQSEVNAIEAGLLNGTAPLNSSHSTLVTLSVTGGSTFAGSVVFQGSVSGLRNITPRMTSTNSTISSGDFIVIGIGSTNLAFVMYTAVGSSGQIVYLKNGSATSTMFITVSAAGAEKIDNSTGFTLFQNDDFPLVSDGANWWVL